MALNDLTESGVSDIELQVMLGKGGTDAVGWASIYQYRGKRVTRTEDTYLS